METPIDDNTLKLFDTLHTKSELKQNIYHITLQVFKQFREIALQLSAEFNDYKKPFEQQIPFEFKDRGEFEFEIHFGGDILIFMMHTNIFEFSRHHEVMKTPYVQDDKERSYCGVINIYNFLADSFKYNRLNDSGYLISRIFVNKDQKYFIEGKREIGLLYTNFGSVELNLEAAKQIIVSAILYTVNFDLLTPPFDEMKEVKVSDMLAALDNMQIKTGKRLGFKFQADQD
ncbi:MAG: hypothetical protein U1C46_01985 [Bacteroidales bacterium]|nr:hypothetical protein [Bacteroidales bacterium]MDZ4203565.1 hypothetical protein [Bacteroidales bacterium]